MSILSQIGAVLLAAGGSSRFGQSKQLLQWRGRPLLVHMARVALAAGLRPVVAVLGCQARRTYASLDGLPVERLVNRRWRDGLSTSVRTGLTAIPPDVDGALFLQCDQPLVTAGLLEAIQQRFEETSGTIVHPEHAGRRGTPVLFPSRFFVELSSLTGDEGGRSLIERYSDQVTTVSVDDPHVLIDVDTPSDFRELQAVESRSQEQTESSPLAPIRNVLIDMDGVLWRGSEPVEGLEEFFTFLDAHDIQFTLATNNASKTPDQYADKLLNFGVDVPLGTILTSALVAASHLADVAPPSSTVFAIGEDGLRQALRQRGFSLTEGDADYVVVGWDRDLSWQKLCRATLSINRGAAFVGTNPDVTFPTEEGPAPGNGAILAALEAATGVSPKVTGKPESRMYEEALRRMGAAREETAMIGDRLDTDIAGAEKLGLTTILTLSGITSADELSSSLVQPDLVCQDIGELTSIWQDAR